MPHTNVSKVTWVIFVEVDPVMMRVSSITLASSGFQCLLMRLWLRWPEVSGSSFLDGMWATQMKELFFVF